MASKSIIKSLIFICSLTTLINGCNPEDAPPAESSPTRHTFKIDETNSVVSLLMSQSEYDSWKTNDEFSVEKRRLEIINDVYVNFKDDFDFIIMLLHEDKYPTSLKYSSKIYPVSIKVKGIGKDSLDNTAKYGSAGKLKAVLQMNKKDDLIRGSTLHLLAHYWGNNLIPTQNVFPLGTNVASSSANPHWGFTGGTSEGQLGGFLQSTLKRNANGSFTINYFIGDADKGNTTAYSQMELYLMGLIPLTDVIPFSVFQKITYAVLDGTTTPKTITLRAEEVWYNQPKLSTLEQREPSFSNSQKEFKTLVVVLTPTKLTESEWLNYSTQSEWFGKAEVESSGFYNFFEATKGKAKMETGKLTSSKLK